MDYTPSQKRAINSINHNLQIIACAGSGKTQVISHRIVKILDAKKKDGITPANIVAFTFTEKAAAELKDRIQRLCVEHLGTDDGLSEMYVGTIHAYCLNLLQQPPVYSFLKFSVLTEVQQRLLIDRYSRRSGLTEVPLQDGRYLTRWVDSRLYQTLLGVLEEGGGRPGDIPAEIADATGKYHALLDELKYLDYSGMLRRAVDELSSNRALRSSIKKTIRYLIVDEYQDINPLQEKLIRQHSTLGANVCVVGDDDQTIYQWRGSDVDNIITFAKRYPGVKTEHLNENFRSSRAIVLTARRIIEQNPERLPKKMESTDAQPFERGDLLALQFGDVEAEADWIAIKVQHLRGSEYKDRPTKPSRGLTYSDMAVLVRAWKDVPPIAEALRKAGVPYLGGGMNSLLDTPEAQAVRDIFYYLADHPVGDSALPTDAALRSSLRNGLPGLTKKNITAGLEYLQGIKLRIPLGSDNQLFLQRVYLDALEVMAVREERIGNAARSGEVIFFNLGKFSQLISDYEHIHFHSSPVSLYQGFAGFLEHQAAEYYPEETEETAHAKPDAVRIMTVHQAKGMQWPVVFVPCLRANRFPSRRQGGRSIWHVIQEKTVPNAERYKGTVEDERRLFYVALTRAERYLFCSWAPANRQQQRASAFFTEFTESEWVLGADTRKKPRRLTPRARTEENPIPLTFSELRYYFQCPYEFKLRFLYGFDSPLIRALGFGKSLHDALCEIHAKSILGEVPSVGDVPRLVKDHLHLPFANDEIRENAVRSAENALEQYLDKHGEHLTRLEHAEKLIELKLADGIVVKGRIDLIRRTDTNEISIVDFKSGDDTQPKEMTILQLHVYAAGFKKATGRAADLIEIHNLEVGHVHREEVNESSIKQTLKRVVEAGRRIRDGALARREKWTGQCVKCDMAGICRSKPAGART